MNLDDIENYKVSYEPVTIEAQELDKDEEYEEMDDFKYDIWADEMEHGID